MTDIQMLSNEQICQKLEWELVAVHIEGNDEPYSVWKSPIDGKNIRTPIFHNSLDAQEKWLWPYVNSKGYWIVIEQDPDGDEGQVRFMTRTEVSNIYAAIENNDIKTAFIKAFTQLVREG